MLKSRWIIAVAFGLVFTANSNAQENVGQPEVEPQATEAQPTDQPADIPPPVPPPVATPANPAAAEHDAHAASNGDKESGQNPNIFLGDGWAQWAMTILAFFGVVISGWAVWLLKRTLDATQIAIGEAERATIAAQDATTVTRDIGQAQVRAYCHIASAQLQYQGVSEAPIYGGKKTALHFILFAKNTGTTPANWYEIAGECHIINIKGEIVESACDIETRRWAELPANTELSFPFQSANQRVLALKVADKEDLRLRIDGTLRYETVFNEIMESEFSFYVGTAGIKAILNAQNGVAASKPLKMTRPNLVSTNQKKNDEN